MGILVNTGFDVGSSNPIDSRTVKNTTDERDELVTDGLVYENLKVYCKDTQKEYRWTGTDWEEVGTGGGDTTYVLPPATDTALGGVKVDNVTITVDSEGVITAINSYTKTEADDLLNNKLDKPAVDGTAGQILVLQDDGSLAYEDNVGGDTADLTEINDKLSKLENTQVKKTLVYSSTDPNDYYIKITVGTSNSFSKILVTDIYGGCLLITGSKLNGNYKSFKVVRLANGSWNNYSPSLTTENKLTNVYYGDDYIYVKSGMYSSTIVEGGIAVEKLTSLPDNVTELPILDLTQGSTVDLTEINDKISTLENNQIKKAYVNRLGVSDIGIIKITPNGASTFSKLLITDIYGMCILITGAKNGDTSVKTFKVVKISNGSWTTNSPSVSSPNKLKNICYDGSYIYLTVDSYSGFYFEGGFSSVETIDSLPSNVTQLPILDLTQGTDLTGINTKLSQLETKANLIPVASDNPTEYDLNNYTENGNYSIGNPANYSNLPEQTYGLLTVSRANTYRLQVYTSTSNNNVYFRKSTDWGKTWTSWVLLNGSSGGSGNDIYTDTQQKIGTWVNGKTLYRKTIKSNGTKSPITNISVTVATVDLSKYTVVKVEGVQRIRSSSSSSANPLTYPIPYFVSNGSELSSILVGVDDSNNVFITTKNLSGYYDYGYDITIYYTDK